MIAIGDWHGDFHADFEQVKRIEAARPRKFRKGILSIDKAAGSMVFKGSGPDPYHTTLNECSCADYQRRHLPCKHIYCLAFELGLMDGLPGFTGCADFRPSVEIRRYRDLYISGRIPADVYIDICNALSKIK